MVNLQRRSFTKSAIALASVGCGSTLFSDISRAGLAPKTFDYGPNRLDWYSAIANQSNAPVIIFVHGGAWAMGNRRQVNSKPEFFTSQGLHFASVSYTLFPRANAQTQALQVGAAVRWVYNNAGQLDVDRDRIIVMGHSAGCHLATLATFADAARPVRALICNDTRAYDLPFLAKIICR